jgi:hypothetical protein
MIKKLLTTVAVTGVFALCLTTQTAYAATLVPHTVNSPKVPIAQNLKPGQPGYVAALNNRPSNAFTPSGVKGATSNTIANPNGSPYGGYWYDYEPTSITVLIRPDNNPSASPTGTSTVNFLTYMQDVLPNEWEGDWPLTSLEAGAVSVRSYAWYCVNNPKYPDQNAALDNTTNSQVYIPNSSMESTNSAISATSGQVLIRYTSGVTAGEQMPAFYKAGSYGPGRDSSSYNFYNNAYQLGEDYYANLGESYSTMLSYYYPGENIITASGY